MSFEAFDAGGLVITFKATLNGSELVPHKNIDEFCGKVVAFGAGAADANTLRVILASDSPGIGGGGGDATAANQTTIIGHVDGIETAIGSTNTKLDTLAGHLDGVEALITATNGAVDGLETAVASTNTKLDTVIGHVDGVETAIGSTNTKLDTLAGHVDGVETLIGSTNTKLDTVIGHVDGVEGALAATGNSAQHVQRGLRTTKALTSAVISTSSSGDTTLVAAVSGQTTRVHRLYLVAAGAVSVTFKRGSTALTGAVALAANTGIVFDFSEEPWYVTAANETFVINLSGAVAVAGVVEYVTS